MANYYSYNTNQVQADINMDNAIKDIQNQLLNIPTDSQLGLKANQSDLDTTNANVAANTSQLADLAINLESFRTNGMSDDTLIATAISNAAGKIIKFPFGKTYHLTQQIQIPAGSVALDLNGSTLNFSSMTSGYAIEIIPSATTGYLMTPLMNGYVLGANSISNNADGIFFGQPVGSTGAVSQFNIDNITVDGFRDNLYFGNQTWCLTFKNLFNIHFWRYGGNFNTVTNAGENIRFLGGTFANGKLGATAVYCPTNINPDVYFHSVSFDYTDSFFNVNGGHYHLYGCHLENNNNNPMIKVTFTSGNSPINFGVFGGTMSTGPGTDTSSPESASGRPWFVELNGTSIAFSMDNVDSYLYNKLTELVHVTSGTPQLSIRSPHISAKNSFPPDISTYINQLYNGDFEGGSTAWTNTPGTGYTISYDINTKYSGTQSVSIASATAANTGITQQDILNVQPGKMLVFSGYLKSNLTAGTIGVKLLSYESKGDVISTWDLGASIAQISGVTDWTRVGMQYVVPAGITKFTIQIVANAINGTAWADNFKAWIV